jgi:hypothetical protein
MEEEPNGHSDLSRIDRIERAIEGLIDGHERLLSSQQQLLTAQVIMADTMTALGNRVDTLIQRVDTLAQKVDAHEDRIQALIDGQLRADETLAFIKKLLERFPGDRP